jgi:protein-S-isoprenylcysteine O-methyltransferase Ste14
VAFYHLLFRLRNALIAPLLFFALFSSSYKYENDKIIWPLGVFIFLVGFFLRIWGQEHLHYRLKGHKSLTLTGPYAFVRNPIYIGSIWISVGAIVTSGLLWLVPITLFYCLGIYSLVILYYEEPRLLDKYGDPYRRYMVEVPRWVPKVMISKKLELINQYFYSSFIIESPCLLVLLPFILKEILSHWFK